MARLSVRSGLYPDAPLVPVAVLLVDPEGGPGERALNRLGSYCHEGDGVFHLVQTDGWAEHAWAGGRLAVDVAVYPFALEQVGVDPAGFPVRSAVDPRAVVVLRVEAAVGPELAARLWEGTLVVRAAAGTPVEEALAAGDDRPIVLAPPPEDDAEDDDEGPDEEPDERGGDGPGEG
ncbi:hypothetical protein ACFYUY_14960 [Kitasatospora sp. NPDC004745]|uniref:hypothetical protein n=1 Tax=Kitasatospora sp. NPDC004745 TaxID=3364019 RepID=UPI0036959CD8